MASFQNAIRLNHRGFTNSAKKRFVLVDNKTGDISFTVFAIRNVKIATWLFVVATVLTFDFELDGVNIFPDILVIAFIIPSFVYISKSTKI